MRVNLLIVFCLFFLTNLSPLFAQSDDELWNLSLDELLELEIVTASKRAQKIEEAPAAVYVITAEDIRLYGANSIGEALRMVPGVDVVQLADHNFQVSFRGLSRLQYNTSNKVLWLVNGRSVYNDAFGGVRLYSINVHMDNIERIEVVRGPGSALYGANAFAGVINIITTAPNAHNDFLIKEDLGNQTAANFFFRHNHRLSKHLSVQLNGGLSNLNRKQDRFADYSAARVDSLTDLGYVPGTDQLVRVYDANLIARYDWRTESDQVSPAITTRLGFSRNRSDQYYTLKGATLFSDYFAQVDYRDARNQFRLYYNGQADMSYEIRPFLLQVEPTHPYLQLTGRPQLDVGEVGVKHQLLDAEFSRYQSFGNRFSLIAGISYRQNWVSSELFDFSQQDQDRDESIYAAFSQLEYKITSDLTLIGGGRLDGHSVVGQSINPRLAIVATPFENHTARLSYGRATRNPHFLDIYMDAMLRVSNLRKLTGLDPIYNLGRSSDYISLHVIGDEEMAAEKLTSFEAGYLVRLSNQLQVKLDAFFNSMTDAIVFTPNVPAGTIERIENINAIFAAQGVDVSALFPEGDSLNRTEMEAKLAELDQMAAYYNQIGQPELAAQMSMIRQALSQFLPIYDIPYCIHTAVTNRDDSFTFYGSELSADWFPTDFLTVTANYSYLKFEDDYNKAELADGNLLDVTKDSEHKFNLGIKFQQDPFYGGIMFNFLSQIERPIDNNGDNVMDAVDVAYPNGGIQKIKPRYNVNVNLGYHWVLAPTVTLETYVTGFNLVQDDYQQVYQDANLTGGDNLYRRFVAGIRLAF